LCLLVRGDLGEVAGAIRFWPVRIGAPDGAAAMLLGPIAVHPTRQGEGLGALLIMGGLDRAAVAGVRRVLLVGDAPYYSRFGFARLSGVEMPPPTNPDRVLGRGDWERVSGPVLPWTPPRPTSPP
jgi:predicted N-acetyltransferase YhbS